MAWTNDQLNAIYDKTNGTCRYCGKRLSFANYGQQGERGAWEVDHSRSRANGGTDHGNNLFAACIDCNRDKSSRNGATVLRQVREEEQAEHREALAGFALLAGAALFLAWLKSRSQNPREPQYDWNQWR